MNKKRLFSLILAMTVFIAATLSNDFDIYAAKGVKRGSFIVYGSVNGSNYKNHTLNITGNGEYTIIGNGKYTSDRIVITSSKMPIIKLKNVKIKSSDNLPAIEIKGRKGADVRIEGFNHAISKKAGISYSGNETLKLSGNGKLKSDVQRNSSSNSYGIYCMNGKLEVKSGTISSNSSIKAKEMKITGGSLDASLNSTVIRNAKNKRVYKQIVTINGAKNKKISRLKVKNAKGKVYNYTYKGMQTNKDEELNVYLPENTAVISANVGKTLYSLKNTSKAAEIIEKKSNDNSNTDDISNNVSILEGTTRPIMDKLSSAKNLKDMVSAVSSNTRDIGYTLMSSPSISMLGGSSSSIGTWATRGATRAATSQKENTSVINVDVSTTGSSSSATEASILVNGKVDIFAIEKKKDPHDPNNTIDMTFEEFKKKFPQYEKEMMDTHNPDGSVGGQIRRYSNHEFKYMWTSGEPSVASLQLPDGAKTLAEGLKPGKTLIRCDISATYIEKQEIQKPVPGSNPTTYTYEITETKRELANVAHVYLTLFVMPDLLDVELTPESSNITVGGPAGSSTCDLTAKVKGLTDSKPNENTDVTINNVQYVWREVLPKSDMTGSYIAITYGTDNKDIDYKEENVRNSIYKGKDKVNEIEIDKKNGLPNAYKVTVQAQKEAKNIKVGLVTYLEYTFKTQEYDKDGKPVLDSTGKQKMVDRTVITKLPEKFVVINIDDKGALTVDKKTLDLTINSKTAPSVDTVTASMSGVNTDLVYFKWWEYSGPNKNSYVDFSNKKGLVAEPDNEDNKALPIYDKDEKIYNENKENMKGTDGATITVQALEAGVTYIYVEGTYINPDTKTSYKKEAVVKVIIKDGSPNAGGSGSGSGSGDGSGGSGSGSGSGNQNGAGGGGNGDLIISELPNVVYNTKAHTPKFTVKSGINLLRSGVDFDYTFMDNIDAGKATLMVNGKNQYDGYWAKRTFDIAKANLTIKNPVLAINTLRENNYTYDLSKLLPNTGMTPLDRSNTTYKLGKSSLPKTNFSNITNGGNTGILSFDAKGITSAGTQGIIDLSIISNPNFNPATLQLTVKSDSGMKVTFFPKNGQDSFTINVEQGSKINIPQTPKKDNATFTGWYDAMGKQWNFDNDVIKSSIDLYAGWRDGNDNANLNTVDFSTNNGKLNQDVIDKSVSEHRDLKVNVLDKNGKIISQFLFDADRLGGKMAGAFDLNTDVYDARESSAFDLLKEDDFGNKGIGITVGTAGLLPVGTMAKIRADEEFGARKGKAFYLYKYDPDTHKLFTIPRRSKIKIDTDGYAEIPIVEAGDYILTAKRPKSKNIVSLKNQIKTNTIKTAKVGESKKIKFFTTPTLKKVKSLKKKIPYYYGGFIALHKSSNKKIALVSKNGIIKFLKKGKVKIYTDIKMYHGMKKRITRNIKVR